MATLRRAEPESGDGSPLPPDIAAGPDPSLWDRSSDWAAAGDAWAREHLAAHERATWRSLLPPTVAYAVSALGRAHTAYGGYLPPWNREDRP